MPGKIFLLSHGCLDCMGTLDNNDLFFTSSCPGPGWGMGAFTNSVASRKFWLIFVTTNLRLTADDLLAMLENLTTCGSLLVNDILDPRHSADIGLNKVQSPRRQAEMNWTTRTCSAHIPSTNKINK